MRQRLLLTVASALGLFPAAAGADCAVDQPPEAARQNGYLENTFTSGFSGGAVDTENSLAPGKKWYVAQFFGEKAANPARLTINTDGTLALAGSPVQINTAAPVERGKSWRGMAFGGGGYFSAVLKVDRAGKSGKSGGWPAFWSMAVEHLGEAGESKWIGQPSGYEHFIEPDFFEDDVAPDAAGRQRYGGAMHDWYGKFAKTCAPQSYCDVNNMYGGHTKYDNAVIPLPDGATLGEFHEFGFLWVPATDNRDGFAQYYFDGQPTADRVSWSKYRNDDPPPGSAPWTFGVMDQQHLVLFLATGSDRPVTVQCVNVWQSSNTQNLTR